MNTVRRPLVALGTMVVLVVVQAVADPTGLLALVPWSGALPQIAAGLWPFAPYLVYLPVLLGILWWVTVRAGDRFWTLLVGVVLAVLLAQAASALVMTGDLAVAGRAAAYVTAKAIPAAVLVAAFARWFGGPTTRTTVESGAILIPAVVFAAIAPLLSGLWWTGAAYPTGVPVLRPDHGILSMLIAVVLVAGATALTLRWLRPRVPGILGGWLAALVAGGLVGLVQAIVAFIVDDGLSGDLWPGLVAYFAVSDGLAFGACLGWIVGVGAILVDRIAARRPARTLQLAAGVVVVAALAIGLVVPGIASASATADTAVPAGFLRNEGGVITDGKGNQVLLRGVNVNNLVDFYLPRPEVPANQVLAEDDFAGIAALGLTVARLNLSWSALEPERGTLDADYLAQIDEAVDWAEQYGIYVVLDMHQDAWWNGATEEGEACRPGTDPMWGYDGAPEWATFTDGAPRCAFTGRDISPAGDRAWQNFYFDTDGIQTALAATWGELAGHFSDNRTVAGYDLLNEPGFGETAPVTTSHLLGQYYDRAIQQIRAAGAPQIVFVEPSILWSGLGYDSGPSLGFTSDSNIAFSPHLYAESLTLDRELGIPSIIGMDRQFTLAERVAAENGAALWSGEVGYWGDDVVERLSRFAVAEDAHLLGSAYWVWRQGCGDPQGGITDVTDAVQPEVCATGADAPADAQKLAILSRAYPRSAPGLLTHLAATEATITMSGVTPTRSCGLDVWIPGADEPDVTATGITNLTVTDVPGGWTVHGCADGEYALTTGS